MVLCAASTGAPRHARGRHAPALHRAHGPRVIYQSGNARVSVLQRQWHLRLLVEYVRHRDNLCDSLQVKHFEMTANDVIISMEDM